MTPYERIVADLARDAARRAAGTIVRSLQRMTEDLTFGDSRLANVWDEVCVQVQLEESLIWFAYEETVRALAKSQLNGLAPLELQALWLQTEAGIEWSCSADGEEGIPPTNADEVVDGLMTEVWSVAADWSNTRIRTYLDDARRGDDRGVRETTPTSRMVTAPRSSSPAPMSDQETHPESLRLGRWGRLFLSSLKTNDPAQFAELEKAGELQKVAASVDQVAKAEYKQTLKALLEKEPVPRKSKNRLPQVDRLKRQAEEIVRSSVLVPNPEWARQQQEGYTDENTAHWSEEPLLPKPPVSDQEEGRELQDDSEPLREYGELYLKALENLRPKEYARRSGSSELREEALQLQERAEAQEDTLLSNMLREDPGPSDYFGRVQHYRVQSQRARELAIEDMMPAPETSDD